MHDKHHIELDPNLPPALHWLLLDLLIFENGECYGQIRMKGTEVEVTEAINKLCEGGPKWHELRIPNHFADKKLVSMQYNALAIHSTSKIIKQIQIRKDK